VNDAPASETIIIRGQHAHQSSGLELLTGGGGLERSIYRVLVVDDNEPWRSFATRTLQKNPELQVVSEASDGLEAVLKAQELQPDMILLDIGLPTLNGIAAARRILQHAPQTRILFMSEQRSSDIVEEALGTGARGYVVKSKAATELWPALEAVLQGKRFVSANLIDSAFGHLGKRTTHDRHGDEAALTPLSQVETACHHEVGFYSEDRRLLDDVTRFIGAALKVGNATIAVATEPHRNSFLPRLQAQGVDMSTAIEQGRYIALDATDALSTFVIDGMVDRVRFMESFGHLIVTATKAAKGEHPRVAFFGEGTHLLWTQGNVQAAIQDEKLCNELTKIYDVDILCGYSVENVHGGMDPNLFQQICAEHSAVHSI